MAMSEWKEYRLSDMLELVGGGTPKTTISDYWDGDIPWLSVTDFNNGRKFVSKTEKYITNAGLENSSTKLLNTGDIIISARGTVGVIAVLAKPMTFNQSCYGVRAIDGISYNDFVYYLLKDTVSNFQQIAHGGVFDTITRDTFNNIDIFLPSLPEQKAIAAVLSSLDDKIDLLHRQNKTLGAMAEALFRQWFVAGAEEDWEEGILGDIVEFNYGIALKEENRSGSGYPVVGSSGIVGFHDKFFVRSPGIVTGRKGTLGVINYMFDNFTPIDTTFYITSKIGSESLLFEYYLLRTCDLGNMDSDSAVPGLNRNAAHSVPITIPPQEIITLFNDTVKPFFEKLRSNQTQIRTLEKIRDTLLPKLMSGEVRVVLE